MPGAQLGLFQGPAVARPAFDASFGRSRRTSLADGAWFEYAQAWLSGHEARCDELEGGGRWRREGRPMWERTVGGRARLEAGVRGRREERSMYERTVEVPRLYAVLPEDGEPPPVVVQMQRALSERYAEPFSRISLGYYRDGHDSVAWHGDYVARRMS